MYLVTQSKILFLFLTFQTVYKPWDSIPDDTTLACTLWKSKILYLFLPLQTVYKPWEGIPDDTMLACTLSLSLAMTASGELLLSEGPMTTFGGVMLLEVDIEWWTDMSPLWGEDVRRWESNDPGFNLELDGDDDDECFDTWAVAPPPIWTWWASAAEEDERDNSDERELLPPVMVTGTWVFEIDLVQAWAECGEFRPVAEEDDTEDTDMRATLGNRGGAADDVLMWGGIGGEELLLLPTSDNERVGVWWWWWEWWLWEDGTLARMFRILGFSGLKALTCLQATQSSKHKTEAKWQLTAILFTLLIPSYCWLKKSATVCHLSQDLFIFTSVSMSLHSPHSPTSKRKERRKRKKRGWGWGGRKKRTSPTHI